MRTRPLQPIFFCINQIINDQSIRHNQHINLPPAQNNTNADNNKSNTFFFYTLHCLIISSSTFFHQPLLELLAFVFPFCLGLAEVIIMSLANIIMAPSQPKPSSGAEELYLYLISTTAWGIKETFKSGCGVPKRVLPGYSRPE